MVFDAALGGSSLSWTYVQPAVAAFTTACAYDRAGFGWSEVGPMPRTSGRIAAELHALLQRGEHPLPLHPGRPLVRRPHHSRLCRQPSRPRRRTGVRGPAHPEDWREPSDADRQRLQRGAALCRRGVLAARLGLAALVARLASAGALDLARGIAAAVSRRTLHRQDEQILAPVTKLPMEVRAVLRWMWTQPRYFEALGSQIEHICSSASEIDPEPDYGSRPLVTISATGVTDERRRLQEALARRSTCGRHITATNSGHWIPIDEPQTVVQAIREVVIAVRTGTGASAG